MLIKPKLISSYVKLRQTYINNNIMTFNPSPAVDVILRK